MFEMEYNKNTPRKQYWIKPAHPVTSREEVSLNILTMQTLHACLVGSPARFSMLYELKTLIPNWEQSKWGYRLQEGWGGDKSITNSKYPPQDHHAPGTILEYSELSRDNREWISPEDCE
jgi:hypothetical protein